VILDFPRRRLVVLSSFYLNQSEKWSVSISLADEDIFELTGSKFK